MKITKKELKEYKCDGTVILVPEDVFMGEPHHPACPFHELFPSSQDPHCNVFCIQHCHMTHTSTFAEICKGDYLKCPLSNGKMFSLIEKTIRELNQFDLCEKLADEIMDFLDGKNIEEHKNTSPFARG